MEELQRSSEKVKNLQQGKERLITKVQELALQVEHYKRAAETSRRDVEDSREQVRRFPCHHCIANYKYSYTMTVKKHF